MKRDRVKHGSASLVNMLAFLTDVSEYVTIETGTEDGEKYWEVSLDGDKWHGVAENCRGDTLEAAVTSAVRAVAAYYQSGLLRAETLLGVI